MNIQGIQGDYSIPKGFVFAKFAGNDYFEELGDTDAVDITVEAERDERKDNRFGTAVTVDSQVTGINVSIAMTLMQMTNRNRALGVMGSLGYMTQEAATETVKLFEGAKAKQFYQLGAFNVIDAVVTDGAEVDPVVKVLGVDYTLDAPSGVFQPLTDGDFEVTFDQPAITNASKRLKAGIGGNPDIQCELLIVGNNTNGAKVHVTLWKVRLTPSGSRSYISESERGSVELEGTVMADDAKALAAGDKNEFAFGIEQTISDVVS